MLSGRAAFFLTLFKMANIKPIRTNSEYENALKRIEKLIATNPQEGTSAFDELDSLGTFVAEYDEVHFPII